MPSEFNRTDFVADMSAQIEQVREEFLTDSDSDDKAFCYAIASMYEKIDDAFEYTDGANDKGIDFYTQSGSTISIYQCKSTDLFASDETRFWTADTVNQLDEAITYLASPDAASEPKEQIKRLRSLYRTSEGSMQLTATLALEGRLTKSGREQFEEIRTKWREQDVTVRLVEETDLYDYWHCFDNLQSPQDVELTLEVADCPNGNAMFKMNDWFCAVLKIKPFMKALDKDGAALFDLNVRAKLRSSINKEIARTIETRKGRRQFVHLNNGLVITCNNFRYGDGNKVTLYGAQIVNGCQTLNTIWDFYKNCSDADREDLYDSLTVLAKVISSKRANKDNLIDRIIVASNSQNPMSERNLKSNSPEQIRLQAAFWQPPLKKPLRYYLIRKDGELESFIDGKAREPRKDYFEIECLKERGIIKKGANRYRHIDNEDLAKYWWSWIGNSSKVNTGGVNFFSPSIYDSIFLKRPSLEFWHSFANPQFSFDKKSLEDAQPTQYQYLLAIAVSRFMIAKVKPTGGIQAFKRKTVERLKAEGRFNGSANPSQQEIAIALSQEKDYLETLWVSQMAFAFAELASFVLVNKYGPLTSDVCKSLIDLSDVSFWLETGTEEKVLSAKEIWDADDSSNKFLLYRLFDFIRYVANAVNATNKRAIMLENRPKLYLSRKDNLTLMKTSILEMNRDLTDYPAGHCKPPMVSFFDSLPSI